MQGTLYSFRLEAHMLLNYFPWSRKAKDVTGLIISIIIYLVLSVILGAAFGLLSKIPVLGWIIGIIGSLVGIYCLIGIVISILVFLKVMK